MKCSVLLFFFFVYLTTEAQKANWQNLDLATDRVFGISTEKAYTELDLHAKKPVLVAVIDNGTDTSHEDLKAILWNNKKERTVNGRDDDHNGYTDDEYGWNFIGSARGNVQFDNLELTRVIRDLQRSGDTLGVYQTLVKTYKQELDNAKRNLDGIEGFQNAMQSILTAVHNPNPGVADLQSYKPANNNEAWVKNVLLDQLQQGTDLSKFEKDEIEEGIKHYREVVDYSLNLDFDPRGIVGDDYQNSNQRIYGNADVTGPAALHGTHVAGIIGALRDNGIGIKGVADQVRIMVLRAVPNGDERDKDIANAIRYAADNGARVINMSFGKGYSHDKGAVDAAVKYAMEKDVLLVAAAGNEGKDLDHENSFPNPVYEDGSGRAAGWITVGASGWVDDSTLVPAFSNYGKDRVDVFAPGVQIYSTVPGSEYQYESGTSMAAPVVTGLAALIRANYPKLTAKQVKSIIMESVVKVEHPVIIRQNNQSKKVPFTDLCVSGGIVNAYNALKLAAMY